MDGAISDVPKYAVSHPAKVRLEDAVLCLNCDNIFNLKEVMGCPNCASRNFHPLSRWLVGTTMLKN